MNFLDNIFKKIKNIYDNNKTLDEILFDRKNFEIQIVDEAKKIKIDSEEDFKSFNLEFENQLNNYSNDDFKNNDKLFECVSLLLVGETIYRTKHYPIDNFEILFNSIYYKIIENNKLDIIKEFLDYIYYLLKYANIIDIDDYKNFYIDLKNKFDKQSKKFNDYSGIINVYCEAIAFYYENNLEEVKDNKELIQAAINKIKTILKEEYDKFYLTLGRLEALNGEYDNGISNIKEAISKAGLKGKDNVIKDYQQYLVLNTTIKTYFLTNNKIDEMQEKAEKLKIDSIKVLSVLTAILSIILGEIQVISNTNSLKEMFILLFAYASVVIGLLGIALFGINLLLTRNKETKKRDIVKAVIIDVVIFAVGLGLAITLFVLNGK